MSNDTLVLLSVLLAVLVVAILALALMEALADFGTVQYFGLNTFTTGIYRTWFALAAFNIGLGHLEDARVLAQRQKLNPDVWADVRKALPLLAEPEHYERAKYGYARGGMPVAFVDRVRAFHDILIRLTPAMPPANTIALADLR